MGGFAGLFLFMSEEKKEQMKGRVLQQNPFMSK